MQLIDALRYSLGSSLALVGAGGKTTAMFRIAREILTATFIEHTDQTVFVSTTTHLGSWQTKLADHFVLIHSLSDIKDLDKQYPKGIVLLVGAKKNNLLKGLTYEQLNRLHELAKKRNISLLIEADGSRLHPLKAPARHEPAIPDFIQNVIVVAGLQGLGKPLTLDWVHRPERFAELSGLHLGDDITGEALLNVLLHSAGGLKGIPSGARRIVLLNQADTPELQSQAKVISERLMTNYHASIIASLWSENAGLSPPSGKKHALQTGIFATIEPIGGVILAAGGSSRFGHTKQLLPWYGQPLIRHIAKTALKSGLSPVVIVVGAAASEVASAIEDLPVRIVINQEWITGLSSSIKKGIESLPKDIGGVVFLQGDQPQIPHSLVKSLVEMHQMSLSPIIVPLIDGQRGNPALFDKRTFSNLLSLKGDVGGRSLFPQFPIQWLSWHDANLLIDIDTPNDYEKLQALYPQKQVEI
jgi:molybdenum cofactor cytidylyltransferase